MPAAGTESGSIVEGKEEVYYKPHSFSARPLRERYIREKYAVRRFYFDQEKSAGKEGFEEKERRAPVIDPSPYNEQSGESAPFIGFLVVKPLTLRVNTTALTKTGKKEPCPWFVEAATGKQFLDNKDHRRVLEEDAHGGDGKDKEERKPYVLVSYEDSALLLGWSGIGPLRFKLLDSNTTEKDRTSSAASQEPGPGHGHSHMGKVLAEAETDLCELQNYEALERGEDVIIDVQLHDVGSLRVNVSFVPG